MLRLLADENLNSAILRAFERNYPEIDFIRVQDTDHVGASDIELLKWAASEQRVLVSHDKRTLPKYLEECIAGGVKTGGVVLIPREFILTTIMEHLAMIVLCVEPEEMWDQCWRLPM